MGTYVKRGGWIYVNDEDPAERWAFNADEAGSVANYLLRVCPTTREAMAKLADMRRAIRLCALGAKATCPEFMPKGACELVAGHGGQHSTRGGDYVWLGSRRTVAEDAPGSLWTTPANPGATSIKVDPSVTADDIRAAVDGVKDRAATFSGAKATQSPGGADDEP